MPSVRYCPLGSVGEGIEHKIGLRVPIGLPAITPRATDVHMNMYEPPCRSSTYRLTVSPAGGLGHPGPVVQTGYAGWIVVLNGPPRSGKSSIVEVIQETFDGPWMNLGVDVFSRRVTPPRYRPGMGCARAVNARRSRR